MVVIQSVDVTGMRASTSALTTPAVLVHDTPPRRFRNADLPQGSQDKWRTSFLRMWIAFFGTLLTPWMNSTEGVRAGIQDIWDIVYPDIPHTVEPQEAVHAIVSV